MRTANLSRERLWELLSPAGPDWGPDWGSDWGSDWGRWQRSYHCFLHEEGADAAMRGRASLFQLWTTQVGNCWWFPPPKKTQNRHHTPPPAMVHTQSARSNSTDSHSACKQCISQGEFLPTVASESYKLQLVTQSLATFGWCESAPVTPRLR